MGTISPPPLHAAGLFTWPDGNRYEGGFFGSVSHGAGEMERDGGTARRDGKMREGGREGGGRVRERRMEDEGGEENKKIEKEKGREQTDG